MVTIGDAKYSIEESPPESSRIVQEQEQEILKDVNLEVLVKEMTNVGHYIHVVSVGVKAAGHTKLQIKVQDIGFSVATLSRESHTAILDFRLASRRCLEILQSTYHFLRLGKEKSALRMLDRVTQVAHKMSEVASDLQRKFVIEQDKVKGVLEETITVRGLKIEKKEEIKQELKKFDILKQNAELVRKQAIEAENKHWRLYEDARRKQYKALKKKSNPFKMIVNAFTSAKFGFSVFGDGTNKEMAEAARDEKLIQLKFVQQQQVIQQEAAQHAAEFMMKVENCKDSSQIADVAIEALQSAVGGLKSLSVVMMRVANFWEQMHKHVKFMQESEFVFVVKEVMSDSKEERQEQWNSPYFLKSAVQYYAQWVALYKVCSQYMMKLEHVQEEMYKVLTDNPDEKEALVKLRKLAKKYRPQIEMDLRGIEHQSSEVKKEIKKLKDEKKARADDEL